MKGFLQYCCLLLISTGAFAAKVDTIAIFSNAMQKSYKCVVITPDTYKKGWQRFPVLYLLHGHSGNYADWVKKAPALPGLADKYQCLIVCPDGGYNSWYFDSPVNPAFKFETYVGTEIPAYIDGHFRTRAVPAYRAITGLSMGGHGALFLAIRHRQTFGAAGSMSGGVDIRPFPKEWEMAEKLGTIEEHPENWNSHTVINLAKQLSKDDLPLIIDCGIKDFFLNVNRSLHQQLMEQGTDHDYIERPGEHDWEYWSNAIEYQLLFFYKRWSALSK